MNKIKMNYLLLVVICCAVCSQMFAAPLRAQQAQQPLKLRVQAGTTMRSTPSQTTPAPQSPAGSQIESGVLTLDQVVNLALAHSPDLALARVRSTVAQNVAGVD
ncbi:MAG: hypothetical protein ACRD37_13240, partial [Candidatus Acidiferrales bacterium]